MWTWGMIDVILGILSVSFSLIFICSIPDEVSIPAMVVWFAVGIVQLIQGFVYMNVANRITALEQYVEGQRAKEENQNNENAADISAQEPTQPSREQEIIAKLNALDPQSRRVVESVIEAESKRSAE